MCHVVVSQTAIRKLLSAAQHLQQLVDDGTIAAATVETAPEAAYRTITAFDVLAETARAVSCEMKAVSPFLRYRREILEDSDAGEYLRKLVLGIFIGQPSGLDLGAMFRDLSDYHIRIVLELIVSYANGGEDDAQFKALANELHGMGVAA